MSKKKKHTDKAMRRALQRLPEKRGLSLTNNGQNTLSIIFRLF